MTAEALQDLRITFHSSPETDPVIPEMITVYHWNRIIAALLGAGVLLGALLSVLVLWIAGFFADAEVAISTPDTAVPTVVVATPVPEVKVAVTPMPVVEEAPAPEMTVPASKSIAAAAPLAIEPVTPPASVASLFETTGNPDIPAMSLSHDFVNGAPVNPIGPELAMTPEGLVRAHFHTPLKNLRGQQLAHEWLWRGKVMASLALLPRRNDTDAHSAKFINREMTGAWQVRVVDRSGTVLVSRDFTVVPAP